MTNELEPCPFCGVASEWVLDHKENCFLRMTIIGNEWIMQKKLLDDFKEPKPYSEEELKASFNTRYKRTCHKVPGKMGYQGRKVICSECGYGLGDDRWSFCPKCGAEICEAEVVDGD